MNTKVVGGALTLLAVLISLGTIFVCLLVGNALFNLTVLTVLLSILSPLTLYLAAFGAPFSRSHKSTDWDKCTYEIPYDIPDDVYKLAKKVIRAHQKLTGFCDGIHHRHHELCNYQLPVSRGWCNCGVSDLDRARKMAEQIMHSKDKKNGHPSTH